MRIENVVYSDSIAAADGTQTSGGTTGEIPGGKGLIIEAGCTVIGDPADLALFNTGANAPTLSIGGIKHTVSWNHIVTLSIPFEGKTAWAFDGDMSDTGAPSNDAGFEFYFTILYF